ncbi:MAG TPA: S8 family serine peptidase [Thermoanaerobaculia bacterium]
MSALLIAWPALADPSDAAPATSQGDNVRYLVTGQHRGRIVMPHDLEAAGGRVLVTCGPSHAVRVPDAARDAFLARMAALGLEVRELQEHIHTPGRRIDPRVDRPPAAPAGTGLFLLQYIAPPLPEWQAAVRAGGATEILPLPERAIVVVATREQIARIAREPWIEYSAPYLPDDKFRPAGADQGEFTLQIADTEATRASIASIEARVGGFTYRSSSDGIFTARFRAPRATATHFVTEPFVLGVETFVPLQPSDERQALSLTGQPTLGAAAAFANALPGTATNYRRWLDRYGFTASALTSSGIVVDVADTGILTGCGATSTESRAHVDLRGRVVYHNGATIVTTGGSVTEVGLDRSPDYTDDGGHGTIVASIIAGNPLSGVDTNNPPQPTTGIGEINGKDPNGFYWGIGIAPGIRVGSTVMIDENAQAGTYGVKDWTTRAVSRRCNTPTNPCTSTTVTCAAIVQNHSNNEYETFGKNAGYYTTSAAEFDKSVRRADHATNVPLAITVSAGNIKQGAQDLTTAVLAPATAKNVISVGATESDRDSTACNGFGENSTLRHKAEDYTFLAYFSRRGTADNRLKPDLLAPASLATGARQWYAGTACLNSGGTVNPLPNYHGSSGTSFAAPVAAGSIALIKHFYGRHTPALNPSPAMYKAILVAGARSLLNKTDRYTNTTITRWPNAQQGFGAIALDPLFNATALRGWRDQQPTPLTQAQSQYFTVTVGDPAKPVRIVLAWTDKEGPVQQPGQPVPKALVNDLDLRATWSDGLQYYGNVTDPASGYSYVPGCGRPLCPSPADVLNNVEVINVDPARFVNSANRTFTVRVWAAVLNGVGVPGASFGAYNQDYALFVLNGSLTPNP